jgi:hypothetical protein
MKMIEIQYQGHIKELEKLQTRLERQEKNLEKKMAIAEKLGATWSREEHLEWLKTVPTNEFGFIVSQEDIKRNGAWFDVVSAENDLAETKGKLKREQERLEKAEAKVEEYRKEIEQIEDLKKREELMKAEFEAEQKEWAKDGIKLEARYNGITPGGKRFLIYGNNGFTERSRHCFTLYIDGETIFTSGEFWRAYGIIRNN